MNDKTNNSNNNTKRIKEKNRKYQIEVYREVLFDTEIEDQLPLEFDVQLHKRCNSSAHTDKSGKEIENSDEKKCKGE